MAQFKRITSKENSLIKLISSLQGASKARKENALFVIEGLRICKDAMDNGIEFDKLIISDTAELKQKEEIERLSLNAKECYILPDSLFKKISDTIAPQGIIALAKLPSEKSITIDKKGKYIALENINDPSNLGAIARTAEALGVSGIILSSDTCDPYAPKTLRASMGTLLRIPVIILEDFKQELTASGLKSFSCVVDKNAKPITEMNFAEGSVVIIGNEANGITEDTKNSSDFLVTIPMKGKVESLNASVAATIAIWEMMK